MSAIRWERTKACGGKTAYWGIRGEHVVAVISRDCGGWFVWLHQANRSAGTFAKLAEAKASVP